MYDVFLSSDHSKPNLVTLQKTLILQPYEARSENTVLNEMVKDLSLKVKILTVENQSLLAEVEMYRKEAAMPNFSSIALGKASSTDGMEVDDVPDEFIKSGNNVFPSDCAATLNNLHDRANILCCTLNPDDTLLATGGADNTLTLCSWGRALAPIPGAGDAVVQQAVHLKCAGPVICVAFSQEHLGRRLPVVAVGYVHSKRWVQYILVVDPVPVSKKFMLIIFKSPAGVWMDQSRLLLINLVSVPLKPLC